MAYRFLSLSLAALALIIFSGRPAFADDAKEHEGKVVKTESGKLTMTFKGQDEKHTHDVAKDAKITLDGKKANLDDLKEGYHVKVTVHGDHGIIKIVAHSKD